MHTHKSMVIPRLWLVTNLTIYSTSPTFAVIFRINKGVELAKLGPLAEFHAQLVGLTAWQVFKTHQETHQRSHHSVIFQL